MFRQLNVRIFILFLLAGLIQGCVTTRPQGGSQVQTSGGASSETSGFRVHEIESFRVTDPEPPKVADQELETIPTEMNPLVEKWIYYFENRGRPHMERYLARSTRYSKVMKKILRQNGLPEDLIYIAMIESGFSSKATSRAAAVGYWQFIRGTGKRYGLEINAMVDERRDPILATQAAAEYFKGLYSVFGSWYLAMASYNVGENRVKKEVMTHYTRDFWELARKRRLPKETVNYIPKYIAAKLIGSNPAKYGFTEIDYMNPIEFELIKVSRPVNLKTMANLMNLEYDDFKQLNPKFKGEIAPLRGSSLELRVPVGSKEQALAAASQSFVDKVEFVADAGETETYRVRSGDSLYTIARKYRTTVSWLRDVNDLKSGKKLRIGQRLQVPDRTGARVSKMVAARERAKAVAVARASEDDKVAADKAPEIVTEKGVFYVVQQGDTLTSIADDYNSSVEELRKMNKLPKSKILKVGMKLKVPKDEGLPADPSGTSPAKDSDSSVESADGDGARQINSREIATSVTAHVVKNGESLTTIAKKYGVSVQAIKKFNNLSRRSVIRVGTKLLIPVEASQSGSKPLMKQNQQTKSIASVKKQKAEAKKIHVVQRGENLLQIANRYRVSLNKLREKNRISSGQKLLVGSRLEIPSGIYANK